jgi:hypothetical protein
MHAPDARWVPCVGDIVRIKGTKFLGTVLSIQGSSDTPLFVLDIHTHLGTDPLAARALVAAAMRTPAIYWLNHLEPHHP